MIAVFTMSCKFQAEVRFRKELASVNITAESRMFMTEDDPIETADLFVSAAANDDLLKVCMFNKLIIIPLLG
jgi:hypothetical protein